MFSIGESDIKMNSDSICLLDSVSDSDSSVNTEEYLGAQICNAIEQNSKSKKELVSKYFNFTMQI